MSSQNQVDKVLLPYELERCILELAANSCQGLAFKLCTLSKYVQPWYDFHLQIHLRSRNSLNFRMEALIYESIVLALPFQATSDLFLRTFNTRPPSFFAKNVKRLYITGIITFDEAQRVLAACSGAHDVTCWVYPHTLKDNLLQQLPTHNLRRLSITLESLWGMSPRAIDLTPSLFPKLSHLEIVNPPGNHPTLQIDWSGLLLLPSLTHFGLGELTFKDHFRFVDRLGKLLIDRPQLKVMVVVTRDKRLVNELLKYGIDGDGRVVVQSEYNGAVSFEAYWKEVKDGGLDFWAAAERDLALCNKTVCLNDYYLT